MSFFRDFSLPLWKVFGGNLLLIVTITCYIAWWTVSFRPGGDSKTAAAVIFISVTLIAGLAAIAALLIGIKSLSQAGKGIPLAYILLGAAALYLILLAVTTILFKRIVTSELLLITVWAAVECSAIAVLHGSSRFSMGQAMSLAVLVLLATIIGIVCYILHYRLDETARFWNGLIPLMVDGGVVAVLLAVLALS